MTCTATCIQPTPTQAHCAARACHRTFGSVHAFDRHRRGGECLHPEEAGMRERNGIWRTPGPDPTNRGWPRGRDSEPQTAENPSGVVRPRVAPSNAAKSIQDGEARPAEAPRRRLRACVENWPGADTGAYDPRCCRFPKSCSATVYDPAQVTDADLEDA